MQDFEKLGVFYLGRQYDVVSKTPGKELLLYDSRDLVTHAVCVGMTGSGKTGLCIALLEEAAIDGIPSLVIDPKGDLSNLLLTFSALTAASFQPWINEDDARKEGLSTTDYAAQQAERWKKGLGDWGENEERIQRLRQSADFAIYTPGSNAGLPLSIMKSLGMPSAVILEEGDLLRERIATTVTSLLGLLGIESDPLRSREHILISTILDAAWKKGQDLDLPALIQQIQKPPVARIGILDLESFFPAKDRFELAMQLNNLLASPGFETWFAGDPLDIGLLLHTPQGKPRVSIFSIAHLNDAERMFFVSLLLNQILGWMRSQSGTTSLRALVYMDEIFGYFPPVANPPSKAPLLTLLKQARAFGIGIVLATQNPVDLDYKGLANTGTWFIGRLQTERDKARVMDGLEGASASAGKGFDRVVTERLLSGLGSRIFLMNNVHEDQPVVFQTRWTLSYLRGPLARNQIKELMEPRKAAPGDVEPAPTAAVQPAVASAAPVAPTAAQRPVVPPAIPQHFLSPRQVAPAHAQLLYQPMILGAASIRFTDAKAGLDLTQEATFAAPILTTAVPVSWENSIGLDIALEDLETEPQESVQYAELPLSAAAPKNYESWKKDFSRWLYASQKLEVLTSPALGEFSKPGEPERDFRIRLQQAGREERDRQVEELRKKYATRMESLQERIRRAQLAVEQETSQARQQQIQTAISFGTTLLGAFLGRKTISVSTLGRATTAARGVGRVLKEQQDIGRATESAAALQQQLSDLEAEFKSETEALALRMDPMQELLLPVALKPKKSDIAVKLVALVWMPAWQDAEGQILPAWQ